VYVTLILVASRLSCLIFLILSIEVLSWIFIKLLPPWRLIKYLILQRIVFIALIRLRLWVKSILLVGVFIKVGLPPFHLWIIRLLKEVKYYAFIFLSTLHKLVPLVILMKLIVLTRVFIVCVGSAFLISILVSNIGNILGVLILSSIIHNFWMVFRLSLSLILFYWTVYSFLLYSIVTVLEGWIFTHSQNTFSEWVWLLFRGIPPFTVFWLKRYVVSALILNTRRILLVFITFFSVLALSAYYRVWHFSSLLLTHSIRKGTGPLLAGVSVFTYY